MTDDMLKEVNDCENESVSDDNEMDETSTAEISQQLINLKMEYEEAKALSIEVNLHKTVDSVVQEDFVENEITVQCVAEEEIIPIEISDQVGVTETEHENIVKVHSDDEEKISDKVEIVQCTEQQVFLMEPQEETQYVMSNQCTDEIAENLQLLQLQTETNKLETNENRIEEHIECVEEIVTEEICVVESNLQENKLLLKENLIELVQHVERTDILTEDATKLEDNSIKSDCSERRRSKRRLLQKVKEEETKMVVDNDQEDVKEENDESEMNKVSILFFLYKLMLVFVILVFVTLPWYFEWMRCYK